MSTNDNFDFDSDREELPKEVRIHMAYDAWKTANGALSIRKAARQRGIHHRTLTDRINDAISRKEANEAMQKLSSIEESSLETWTEELYGWGWPPRRSEE